MTPTLSLLGDDGAEECGDSLGVELDVVGIKTEDPVC